jgi:uncharacterized membrane protein
MALINKTKISIIIGIFLIIAVASMMAIPFTEQGTTVKQTQEALSQYEESEKIMLSFIEKEKAELESKIGGKIKVP